MTPSELNEEKLVEIPAEHTFSELYDDVKYDPDIRPGRELQERDSLHEVLLKRRLRQKLVELNPGNPDIVYDIAVQKIELISEPTLIETNRAFHQMLLSGIKVAYQEDNQTKYSVMKLIDFDNPEKNDFIAVRQFLLVQHEERRLDHVIFVNGIPLIILEYKSMADKNATIVDAFHQLGKTKYQRDIPIIFRYNAFLVISDRLNAKYGTINAPFERFSDWNDLTQPDKKVANRLEILQKLLLNKTTILDVIKNFIEYESDGKNLIKKICQQHQYHAVNTIVKKTSDVYSQQGENRIGVVWHTTGSGKSLTMIYYVNSLSQIEKFENPTFIIITDRRDLDEQLNHFFRIAGFPYPKPETAILEADSILDLREKLQVPSGKIIFTTIQKFQTTEEEREGKVKYPKISDRRNIIIIADEAHRSQYKKMAQNLQTALPNALRIGFTGTPIELEDRSTTQVFGDIISSYKIPEAVRDGATVQISCETHPVTLLLLNKFIGKDFEEITQGLDEENVTTLARRGAEFTKLVEDPDRIKTIANDIVSHFNKKQKIFKGKAMIATSTKLAAARFADYISSLKVAPECTCIVSGATSQKPESTPEKRTREAIIQKHYKDKLTIENILTRFKDENDPLSLLIVCDMYLTGFDAPLIHTMYIDKPLRDHNLIQAISRVNRVWKNKPGGAIIDYIGIADDLDRAFSAYAQDDVKGAMIPTAEIIEIMKKKHSDLINFFDPKISNRQGLDESQELQLIYDAIDEIVYDDIVKREFIKIVTELTKAYAVCTPHPSCLDVEDDLRFFQKLRKILLKATSNVPVDLTEMESAISDLVEQGIGADQVVKGFKISFDPKKQDISKEYLNDIKKLKQKNLKAELAYKLLDDAIQAKFKRNLVKRKSFQDRIEEALSKYHARFWDNDDTIQKLEEVGKEITNESSREQELGLNDEEIAFYDVVSLGKDYVKSDAVIKQISLDLTKYLKGNIRIDWINQENIKAEIRMGVRKILLRADFPTDKIEEIVPKIMDQAETNYG
ncbi:type I restriction endonuclease subunit R [Nitrosarchaeum koreense]|uniref:type I site-specific deoxyribonuclease n=1 Tax=Nitrosarchaeum koreense MY1 TaxID=1001994 RepID=F9CXT2_9ARCH|nr:type I restriction endonuclease subunit R [Nitrosarchaeum koreense]EGP94048.1 Type I site-specific deoxyribonuclease, HsdR family [Nitrosarchaeum koreense MY1]